MLESNGCLANDCRANSFAGGIAKGWMILRLRQMHLASRCILIRSWPYEQRRISKLSAPERGVYAASLSLLSQLSLNPNLAGSFTLKRPEEPV